jgi:hypothetical protein
MMNRFAAISVGAVIALSPLAVEAQSVEPAQFEQVAQADTTAAPATPRGSHKRHLRNQHCHQPSRVSGDSFDHP